MFCVDCHASLCCRGTLRTQLGDLYRMGAANARRMQRVG
jgi:hypothetical protein